MSSSLRKAGSVADIFPSLIAPPLIRYNQSFSPMRRVFSTQLLSRARLTTALLDRMAPLVREWLGVGAADFPLARMLEGGSWMAGRRVAAERRADCGPPLTIISDGTVF